MEDLFALAVAFRIKREASSLTTKSRRKARYRSAEDGVPGERCCSFRGVKPERSPKGKATKLLPLLLSLPLHFHNPPKKINLKTEENFQSSKTCA
jgi:hypothetical protein